MMERIYHALRSSSEQTRINQRVQSQHAQARGAAPQERTAADIAAVRISFE